MKYTLVNPFVTGNLETTFESDSALVAAKALYSRVSTHFKNNVPRFFFSLMGDKNKLYHFEVNEKKIGKEVNFTIKEAKMKKSGEKVITKVVTKKMEQMGGKKHRKIIVEDSSSSDDSSSSSPYQLPYYVNPLRELLYYPMDYVIEVYEPDVVYEYPLGISYPSTNADYNIIYTTDVSSDISIEIDP